MAQTNFDHAAGRARAAVTAAQWAAVTARICDGEFG
jgi:hypothetical protein